MSKPNKDGWIRHRGGSCPVEAGTLVDVRLRSGEIMLGVEAITGWADSWTHDNSEYDAMAWRPHNHEQQIEPAVIANVAAYNARAEMQLDGPLQWRDRIAEINRMMADLRAEKAGLLIKLSDEGFALIGEQPF